MLVLSRLRGEKILVMLEDGREVEIEIIEATPSGRVRLGFTADKTIRIIRDNAKNREHKVPVQK